MGASTVSNIIFVLTEDCQLRCSYCYLTGKNNKTKSNVELLEKAVETICTDRYLSKADKVVFSFIGGEPFLAIELIKHVSYYIEETLNKSGHRWKDNYSFQITTNGLLYSSKKVQEYIQQFHDKLDIDISIDGTKKKHDTSRVFPNGKGSYDIVRKNVDTWVRQFQYTSTKMVISHYDVPYLFESVKHLLGLGISFIEMNPVLENTWMPGDEKIYEDQLIKIADYVIDSGLYHQERLSVFKHKKDKAIIRVGRTNPCGDFNVAVGTDGNLYTCLRLMQYSLQKKKARYIGNIETGLEMNLLRPLLSMDNNTVFPTKCFECDIARNCKWCLAENYDSSSSATIFQKANAICKLHRAEVRAQNYYCRRIKILPLK